MTRPVQGSRVLVGATTLLLSILVTGLLAACEEDAPERPAGDWAAAETLVARDGLVWSAANVVHLGDGSTVDVGEPIRAFVVAGDGIYYLGVGPGGRGWTDLRYAPADGGDVVKTGARPEPESITVSPDGRHLGFVDRADVPAATVVVDLTTGTEVVSSNDGLTDSEDLEAAYDEVEPAVLAIDDDSAWVKTLDGVLEFDLGSGESTASNRSADDVRPARPDVRTVPNPAGTWTIDNQSPGGPHLVAGDGREVRAVLTEDDLSGPLTADPSTPWDDSTFWALTRWLDDDTAVAIVAYGESLILVACPVSTGDCAPLPGGGPDAHWPLDLPAP